MAADFGAPIPLVRISQGGGGRPQEGQEAQGKPIAIPPAHEPETPRYPGTGTRHPAATQLASSSQLL